MHVIDAALRAASQDGYVGHLQACEQTNDDGEPTGESRTLIDGYFDLRRAAEFMVGALAKDAGARRFNEAVAALRDYLAADEGGIAAIQDQVATFQRASTEHGGNPA